MPPPGPHRDAPPPPAAEPRHRQWKQRPRRAEGAGSAGGGAGGGAGSARSAGWGGGERRMGAAELGLERRAGSAIWSLGAGSRGGGGPPVRAEVQGSLVGVFELDRGLRAQCGILE